jgi:lipopolysaccharide/colanic/teichoic acid biosynthesis glycosyltransferase
MSPQQIAELGSDFSAAGRMANESNAVHPEVRRPPTCPAPEAQRTIRPARGLPVPARSLLTASGFQVVLDRERCLADRGTRRFSLLALRLRSAGLGGRRSADAIDEFAREARQRLRSTDVVCRPSAERLEVLLTDTGPAGAQVLAPWFEQSAARLGLDLDLTTYVYPSVAEPGAGNEPLPGPAAGCTAEALPAAAAPMVDLWPQLDLSTPRWKRCIDVLVSASALLLLSPLFVLIAIAIRLDSPGPVIFRQWRAGRGGRPFVFYKFRSMVADAEQRRAALAGQNEQDGPIFKMREDPRITRVGRRLRRWSLDELPQLWNVLKGDISLVGPRSPTLDELARYERWQRRRLAVTGGITCTWQVSGRSQIPFREWMRLDLRYVERRSAWLDLWLLVRTLPAVITGRGAC